jgi:Helix-turn-helix domain
VTLPELRAELTRRAADADRIHATAPAADVYRSVIADLDLLDGQSIVAADNRSSDNGADRLISVKEAAGRLGVSPRWLYNRPDLPFMRRIEGRVRVSERALERYLARRS